MEADLHGLRGQAMTGFREADLPYRDQDDGPDQCDECEGSGIDVVQSTRGPLETDEIPCWRCGGSGQVG